MAGNIMPTPKNADDVYPQSRVNSWPHPRIFAGILVRFAAHLGRRKINKIFGQEILI